MDVLYLCDRRACEKCSPECQHTRDVSHAKNFEVSAVGLTIIETARPLVILKINAVLKKDVLNKIREELTAQITTGVILCSPFIEPIKVDSDGIIYDVSVTERKDRNEKNHLR